MNETNDKAKRQWTPGGLFVVSGIVFCTLGGTNIISGIIQQKDSVVGQSNTGKIVAGGLMLAAGIINVAVGLRRKRMARSNRSA